SARKMRQKADYGKIKLKHKSSMQRQFMPVRRPSSTTPVNNGQDIPATLPWDAVRSALRNLFQEEQPRLDETMTRWEAVSAGPFEALTTRAALARRASYPSSAT